MLTAGGRRVPKELVELVEGLALRRPPPRIAEVHRTAVDLAAQRGLPAPSYQSVRRIIERLDRGLLALAHHGPEVYRDNFELVLRREAAHPNDVWQADHTELDVMILDESGTPARPWLTVILDDHSRAVAGYILRTTTYFAQVPMPPVPTWPGTFTSARHEGNHARPSALSCRPATTPSTARTPPAHHPYRRAPFSNTSIIVSPTCRESCVDRPVRKG